MLSLLETTCSFIVTGCVSYLSLVIIIIGAFFSFNWTCNLHVQLSLNSWNFWCQMADVSHETSLEARSKKRWLYFTGYWSEL